MYIRITYTTVVSSATGYVATSIGVIDTTVCQLQIAMTTHYIVVTMFFDVT